VLEYDDVMNKQREIIYTKRKNILERDDLKEIILDTIKDVIEKSVDTTINPSDYPEKWDLDTLSSQMSPLFSGDIISDVINRDKISGCKWNPGTLKEKLVEKAYKIYDEREMKYTPDVMRRLEKIISLNVIDSMWRGHLLEMDYLKEGIGLRAIGQRDPLVEYRREAFNLFRELIDEIKFDTVRLLYNVRVVKKEEQEKMGVEKPVGVANLTASGPSKTVASTRQAGTVTRKKKIGRNDPCPCGSGKKYKNCCGRYVT